MHHPSLIAALTASLAALPVAHAAGLYTKGSPVLQVDARSYERLIANSNYTSIVEFYAPWCGHCQSLKPAYEKAAKNLDGLAKVAAVNCDEDANKSLCGSMGVQGFPTLKIVRPGKKAGGKPVVEDYQGQRTAGAIVEAVVSKINNHVTRLTDKELDSFLEGDKPKAILFTDKGTTSALLRSIAIDFLDVISVGQVRNKEKAAVEKFGVTSFPTVVLIPADGQDPITYEGELNKKDLVEFLKQAGEPNPDPAPASSKSSKKSSSKAAKASEAEESSTTSSETTTAAAAPTPTIIDITTLTSKDMLEEQCLQRTSHTCVLALVPASTSETGKKVVASLSQLNTKYIHGNRHAFPFFSVPSDVEGSSSLREALGLKGKAELIVMNARRGWWRQYEGDFSIHSVEAWLDSVRMGEGEKKTLPKEVVVEQVETSTEETSTEATQATDPEPEVETEAPAAEEAKVEEEEQQQQQEEEETEHDEL